MSEFVKKSSAIKFGLRNEIPVAETFRMLQKAFGDLTMSQKMFISGTKTSKKEENVLMTWKAPDDHQHQLSSNMSIKSKN